MEPAIRNEVRQRAGNRCEYCRLRQEDEEENPFHLVNQRLHHSMNARA